MWSWLIRIPEACHWKNHALSNARVYVSAQNLLTFTKYNGLDPDVVGANFNLEPGVDLGGYPSSRIISLRPEPRVSDLRPSIKKDINMKKILLLTSSDPAGDNCLRPRFRSAEPQ